MNACVLTSEQNLKVKELFGQQRASAAAVLSYSMQVQLG